MLGAIELRGTQLRARLSSGRRRREFAGELPDVARALARGFAAGLPMDLAALRAADAVAEPAGRLLRQSATALRAGALPVDAFRPLAEVDGGALLAGALALNAELGGDVVSALHALAEGLADRERLRGELAAMTAQARFAARVVPFVPVGALGLLQLLSPSAVGPLLGSSIGLTVCAGSAMLTATALLLMRRIVAGALP